MTTQSRRDALCCVAELAAVAAVSVGAAVLTPSAAASIRVADDPLLELLNRYLAENAWLDAYHADMDGRRDELGWDRVQELLTETLKASDARCEAPGDGSAAGGGGLVNRRA
jgi:hypothetical protein